VNKKDYTQILECLLAFVTHSSKSQVNSQNISIIRKETTHFSEMIDSKQMDTMEKSEDTDKIIGISDDHFPDTQMIR